MDELKHNYLFVQNTDDDHWFTGITAMTLGRMKVRNCGVQSPWKKWEKMLRAPENYVQ